ncbi:AAA ATPase [Trypanosoma melophagium]|uniref:AAA ATPase n=1 Tax=Trypanosoma melophagium TaxID=715481 RepID=UPI00351A3195|nr:AAA ATPase [Trypanosoma melophagium]
MFASLRSVYDQQNRSDRTTTNNNNSNITTTTTTTTTTTANNINNNSMSTTGVKASGDYVPRMRQLRSLLFTAIAASESHYARLHEEHAKEPMISLHGNEKRANNNNDNNSIPFTLQKHFQAVMCEAMRRWQYRKQQEKEKEVDRNSDIVWMRDHGVLMNSEEDIAQLLWMNRSIAIGATISLMHGIHQNSKKSDKSISLVSSSSQQKEKKERGGKKSYYKSLVDMHETIRILQQSSPALRAVLIAGSPHTNGASQREERDDKLPNETNTINTTQNGLQSISLSSSQLISSQCPPVPQSEMRSKRSRVRDEVEVNAIKSGGRGNKRPFALAVKIDGRVLRPQENSRSEVVGTTGTLYEHINIQQQQKQQQQQLSDTSYGGNVSSHTSSHPKSQMTLNVDSRGKLCLTQPPVSPLSHLNSILKNSSNTPVVGNTDTPAPSTTNTSFAIKRAPHHWNGDWTTVDSSETTNTNTNTITTATSTVLEENPHDTKIKENRTYNPPILHTKKGGKEDLESKFSTITTAGHPSGGFITAGEQLVADVKAGRSMPSGLSLQRRTPALGLRRSGFTPPFQQQQQRQQLSPPPQRSDGANGTNTTINANNTNTAVASNGVPVNEVLSSISKTPRNTRGDNNTNHSKGDDSDNERGDYPASLLLPDGSVPPILLPLDPKLVTQVAMEILEHGAGAASVGWDDIAGLEHAKRSVEEAIVWPLRRPDLFVGLRDPPRGLLLFGPPGTGKTMIARAIANRAQCTFLNISASSLMSKWMGDGEKLVRCMFAVATVKQPSVIFIDEIDSLLSMRGEGEMDSVRRVKTEFLVQLDGVATDRGDRVLLIGATNRPDELDEAARRRMEKRLYIPLPDAAARVELVKRLLHTMEEQQHQQQQTQQQRRGESSEGVKSLVNVVHALDEKEIAEIAAVTEGYSGADLKQVCREAAMGPLREVTMRLTDVMLSDLRPIQRKDFTQALKRIRPSVGVSEVTRYVEWNEQFGSFTSQGEEAAEEE